MLKMKKMVTKTVSLLIAVALLSTMLFSGTVFAADEASAQDATGLSLYKQAKYLLGSSDCSETAEQELAFWNFRLRQNYKALEDSGVHQGHGSVFVPHNGYAQFLTKKLNGDNGYASGEGVLTFGFDLYQAAAANDQQDFSITAFTSSSPAEVNRGDKYVFIKGATKLGFGHPSLTNDNNWPKYAYGSTAHASNTVVDGVTTWQRFDFVIDMVNCKVEIYRDGVLENSMYYPAEMLSKMYAFSFETRNLSGTAVPYYIDNFELYWTPVEDLAEVATYKCGENRIGWTNSHDGSTYIWSEGSFWNDIQRPWYADSSSRTSSTAYGKAFQPGAMAGAMSKNVGGEYGYLNGLGSFTFSFDKFENTGSGVEVGVSVCESLDDIGASAYDSYTNGTKLWNELNGSMSICGDSENSISSLTDNEWKHYDIVVDMIENNVKLFIDDVEMLSKECTIDAIRCIAIKAKSTNDATNVFYIDNPAVYWTPAEIFSVTDVKVTDESGNKIQEASGITAGANLKASVLLSNNTGEVIPEKYMLSYAVYNGNKLSAVNFVEGSLADGQTLPVELPFTVESTTELKIKVFVWDGINTMKPRVNNIVID